MYEQLYMGTIDMALETIAFQSTTHPELTIEDLPYMFATREDGYKALDGGYGDKINEIIASGRPDPQPGLYGAGLPPHDQQRPAPSTPPTI